MSVMELVVPARPESVATVRSAVVSEAAKHLDPQSVDDIALVTSELVTNAVHHGTRDSEVVVHVRRSRTEFVLTVCNNLAGEFESGPGAWSIAPPDSLRGRGLGIVKRLAPSLRVDRHDDRVVVNAAWPLEAA